MNLQELKEYFANATKVQCCNGHLQELNPMSIHEGTNNDEKYQVFWARNHEGTPFMIYHNFDGAKQIAEIVESNKDDLKDVLTEEYIKTLYKLESRLKSMSGILSDALNEINNLKKLKS